MLKTFSVLTPDEIFFCVGFLTPTQNMRPRVSLKHLNPTANDR
jgi:hypothetical protein